MPAYTAGSSVRASYYSYRNLTQTAPVMVAATFTVQGFDAFVLQITSARCALFTTGGIRYIDGTVRSCTAHHVTVDFTVPGPTGVSSLSYPVRLARRQEPPPVQDVVAYKLQRPLKRQPSNPNAHYVYFAVQGFEQCGEIRVGLTFECRNTLGASGGRVSGKLHNNLNKRLVLAIPGSTCVRYLRQRQDGTYEWQK